MFVMNEKGILVKLEQIQSAEAYNEADIITMLNGAKNQRQYDSIVDRLFFQRDKEGRKQCKNRHEYSFYTARTIKYKEKQEIKDKITLEKLKSN